MALLQPVRVEGLVTTIVVTGAGGFIGSALIPLLLEALPADIIRAQIRHTPLVQPELADLQGTIPGTLTSHPRLELLQGDLSDAAFCELLCQGADHVIHLAGYAHTAANRNTQLTLNLVMTETLARAAVAMGVAAFTCISSIKAKHPDQSPYAEIKQRQEALLFQYHEQDKISVTCLRPALVYGPGMKGNLKSLLNLLSRPFLPVFPAPVATIGLISLNDCCRAIIVSLTCPALAGQSWQLDEGIAYPLRELFSRARTIQGLAGPVLPLPGWCVKAGIRMLGALAPLTGKAIGMGSYHSLYSENWQADPAFGEVTGWTPTTRFYDELPQLIKSVRH